MATKTTTKKNKKQINLTTKQEAFAVEYLTNGRIAVEAYRKVYNTENSTSASSLYVSAHRLLHHSNVSLRIKELQRESFGKNVLSVLERKEMLSEMASGGDLKALDMLNKMEGQYVEKQEIEHKGELKVKATMKDLYSEL